MPKHANGRLVELTALPECDFCGDEARYDGPTAGGPHANMCEADYQAYGIDGSTITSILYVDPTEPGDIEGMRKGLIAE